MFAQLASPGHARPGVVGVVEIVAGILVAAAPRIGSWLVAAPALAALSTLSTRYAAARRSGAAR